MTEWKEEAMEKIRWATVGYHFQWTRREYVRDIEGIFPDELKKLCSQFAHQVGYEMEPQGNYFLKYIIVFRNRN